MKSARMGVALAIGLVLPQAQAQAQTGIRTEAIEYHDNLGQWVLGQTAKVTNVETGMVVSETQYNGNALPWKAYSFGRLQQTLTYNTDGTLATASDGRDGVGGAETTITLSSWKRGIPQSIKYPVTAESPSGATESAVVNNDGTIASVTDENGYKTCYTYDAMGRLASITYPSETQLGVCDASKWGQETFTYEQRTTTRHGLPPGHWALKRRLGNRHVNTLYDAMWRPVLEEQLDYANLSNTLSQVVKRYDASGRLVFQSYPTSNVGNLTDAFPGATTGYDALGRVTRVDQDSEFGALTTTSVYETGFKTKVTNPRQQTTTTSYRVYDQPTTDWPIAIAHPEGAYTDITRDVFDMPTAVTRRNASGSTQLVRRYVYGTLRRLCMVIEPETGTTVFNYDGADNLTSSAAGLPMPTGDLTWPASGNTCGTVFASGSTRRVNRTYDARNRLTALTFPDGRGNQSLSYTPDGLPSQITTYNDPGNGTPVVNAYTYNARRLLTGESSSQPGWYTWGLGYAYNGNGHLQGQTYPTNLYVDYAPNALGQPTKAGAYASGVSYYPNGGIKQFTYGNGIVHTMVQNARQLPQRSTSSNGVLNDVYNYDANGNVESVIDELVGAGNWSPQSRWMTYDGLDRLTGAGAGMFGGTDNWHRFTYDALDNIKSWKLAGVKDYANYYYDPSSNRLTNIQNSAGATIVGLGYDLQGNLQNKNGQDYFFDYGNRLREVIGKEQYRYDGHGRRVLNWRPNNTGTLSQYSQAGQLLYQQDSTKRINREYVYLGGSLVATREWSDVTSTHATKYQHTDALGSPVAVTNESGQVVERTQWEPYGAAINKTVDGIGYTGHVMDGATGLTYMQQRYYDPGIGRFLSVDPVTANSSTGTNFNRYWYANNNPYRFFDPDGRSCTEANGVHSCVVDSYADKHGKEIPRADMTKAQLKSVRGFEKAYTAAVNKLMASPQKSVTISMPSQGKTGEAGKQTNTTAGEVGKALIARNIVANSPLAGSGMSTGGNTTYLGALGLSGQGSIVGVTTNSNDALREIAITHEGMHGDGTGVSPALRGDMKFDEWSDVHQAPLNQAAKELLGL